MENLNLVELLRDCPTGMELDCAIFEDVYFDNISDCGRFIYCYINHEDHKTSICFNKYGAYSNLNKSKCVIFPKGKTTWEGFVPPYQFKDGDVVISSLGGIHILEKSTTSYCYLDRMGFLDTTLTNNIRVVRLATEEEKQKLFDAIKANGYRWNAETKTLGKLPKFKVGDVIVDIYKKYLHCDSKSGKISQITDDKYIFDDGSYIPIQCQNNWELAPNKFDINILVPFESRVLVRDYDNQIWIPTFWGKYLEDDSNCRYLTFNGCYKYCIPYERNEHLLGTSDDCDPFFKTWEK